MIGTKLFKGKFTDEQYLIVATWCNKMQLGTIVDKGDYYEVVEIPAPSLDELKTAKLQEAGSLFAQKRDARRFVKLDENRYYGFDCASEDITNFLARWTPLAMMGGGESQYKVWINETNKDLVMLSLADYNLVYQVVSASQLQAYDWYKVMEVRIKACTTKEELEAIVFE
jgi:hypothetical protein